jgi:hypothetical protein
MARHARSVVEAIEEGAAPAEEAIEEGAAPAEEANKLEETGKHTIGTIRTASVAFANEELSDLKAVVKSLLVLYCFTDVEKAFHELRGESNEVQAFDGIYNRLEDFLHFQVDEVDSLLNLLSCCFDGGEDRLISEAMEGTSPDVPTKFNGGTLLDLVDYFLSNLDSALSSVMSRIRPAATDTPASSDVRTAITLVDTCLRESKAVLHNIREDANALFLVTSAEEIHQPNQEGTCTASPAKKMRTAATKANLRSRQK